jgi:hypothetical protein
MGLINSYNRHYFYLLLYMAVMLDVFPTVIVLKERLFGPKDANCHVNVQKYTTMVFCTRHVILLRR